MPAIFFDTLPEDILLSIFACSTPQSVRQCQQVCRMFNSIISTYDYLQYLLALAICGYVEPLCPRRDISYAEKTQLLREHNARWNNLARLTPERYLLPPGIKSTPGLSTLTAGAYVCTRNDDMTDLTRLTICQLPSNNKGTKFERRRFKIPFIVKYLAIDPDQDLLALLEVGDSHNFDIPRRIHLRAATTNEPHPRASERLIIKHIRPMKNHWDTNSCDRVMIFGSSLAGVFDLGEKRRYAAIWNWTTGHELLHLEMDETPQQNTFELLSPSSFIVSRALLPDTTKPCVPAATPGYLEVHHFDSEASLPVLATHITTFELPALESSVRGWYEISIHLEAAMSGCNDQPSPRIYDLAPSDRLLWVTGTFFTHDPRVRTDWGKLRLCTPIPALLDTYTLGLHDANSFVPWAEWGHNTIWGDDLDPKWCPQYEDQASGQRVVFESSSGLSVVDFNNQRLSTRRARTLYSNAIPEPSDGQIESYQQNNKVTACVKPGFDIPRRSWFDWQRMDDEHGRLFAYTIPV